MSKAEKKEKSIVNVQDVLQEKAEQSAKNLQLGKEEVKVSLTELVKVRFKEDFRHMKKDQVADISSLAYDFYQKVGVVETLKN